MYNLSKRSFKQNETGEPDPLNLLKMEDVENKNPNNQVKEEDSDSEEWLNKMSQFDLEDLVDVLEGVSP